MKVLSVTQPWASLIAIGAKKIETRSWPTKFRGRIAIHASKRFTSDDKDTCNFDPFRNALGEAYGWNPKCFKGVHLVDPNVLPTGVILCTAELYDCQSIWYSPDIQNTRDWVYDILEKERAFGDFSAGRFGWFLRDVRPLPEPIPAKGSLGLWDFDVPEVAP